jgi:hypothetical protein
VILNICMLMERSRDQILRVLYPDLPSPNWPVRNQRRPGASTADVLRIRFTATPHAQTDSSAKASSMKVALMSVMAKLESILGRYLFEGMKASRMRRHEEDRGQITFTDAVRLRLAYQLGEDFLLEVWLKSSIGKAISQIRSVEDLRNILGNYLFEAMEASNRRKEEKRKEMRTWTNAVNVSSPSVEDGDEDSKLRITLSFEIGRKVHEEAYPS